MENITAGTLTGILIGGFVLFLAVQLGRIKPEEKFLIFSLFNLGIFIVFLITLDETSKAVKGSPRDFIEPGRYTVIKVVPDASFVTDSRSTTELLLKDNNGNVKFYLLPTNELKGDPEEGGILLITKITAPQEMLFKKF